MTIQLSMVINAASEMALSQTILPSLTLRKHLWDKVAKAGTKEEQSTLTPKVFLCLMKYMHVDPLWIYAYREVLRQTPGDLGRYKPALTGS